MSLIQSTPSPRILCCPLPCQPLRKATAIAIATVCLIHVALLPSAHARIKPINFLGVGGPAVVASGRYALQAPPKSQWQRLLPSERIGSVVSVGPYWITAVKEDVNHKTPRIIAYHWSTGDEAWSTPLPEGTEAVGLLPLSVNTDPSSDEASTPQPLIVTLPIGIVFKLNSTTGKPEWVKAVDLASKNSSASNAATLTELHLTPVETASGITVVSSNSTLFHLNPNTGELLWQTTIQPPPAALSNASETTASVASSTSENTTITSPEQKPLPLNPLALNPLASNTAANKNVSNSPEHLLLASEDGFLTCVDATTGTKRWHTQTAGSIRNVQWVVDRWIVTSNTGLLTAINPHSGSSQWALVSLDGKPLVSSTTPVGSQWVTASLKGNVLMANAKTGIRSGTDKLPSGLTGGWAPLSDGSLLGTLTDGRLIAYEPPKPQSISGYKAVKRNKHTDTKTPIASNIRWELPLNHRVVEPPVLQALPNTLWLLTASTDGTVQGFNWTANDSTSNQP